MKTTINIPIMGAMRQTATGEWVLKESESVFADVDVDEIAKLIIRGFGGVSEEVRG